LALRNAKDLYPFGVVALRNQVVWMLVRTTIVKDDRMGDW